jgi:hypothetical protein
VFTDKKNINQLKKVNETNYLSFKSDPDFTIIEKRDESKLKDSQYNCGISYEVNGTNGNERIKLELTAGYYTDYVKYYPDFWYRIRPQRKTLGIWLPVSGRHIAYQIKLFLDYQFYNSPTWNRAYWNFCYYEVDASKIEDTLHDSYGTIYMLTDHFGALDCWAYTYATINTPAVVQCNTQIF